MVCHPVAVHIYTQNNTQNKTNNNRTTQITTEQHKLQLMWKSAGRAPYLRVLPWHFCLKTEEKVGENPSQGKKKTPVRVQYIYIYISKTPTHYKTHTNTHITKQYKTTTVQIKTNTIQDIPK